TIDSNHPKSDLESHRVSIIEAFQHHPPATSKEAAARIETLTGVKRSEQRVRVFMKNIGMKFRKVGAVPAKADLEKQEDFKKTFLKDKRNYHEGNQHWSKSESRIPLLSSKYLVFLKLPPILVCDSHG
ncbi:MAG: winged helix-turn-helix domain-containing protein, partial [Planctomycetaceae bacterium]|nr:winged helix-turn-helix domain-containing protein [Planctomycetaceae bacterium]